MGGQRHTELLCKVARIPTQRLCGIVSVNLCVFCNVSPLRNRTRLLSHQQSNTFQQCASLMTSRIFNILFTVVIFRLSLFMLSLHILLYLYINKYSLVLHMPDSVLTHYKCKCSQIEILTTTQYTCSFSHPALLSVENSFPY